MIDNLLQTSLSPDEMTRYSRHLLLPEVGVAGQLKVKQASILLIGVGGLGSPLALYLTAAGIGRLGLVDMDVVDTSNLQRQVLYSSEVVGQPKLQAARERLVKLNPFVQIETYETRLCAENALEILSSYDIIIDGTDNFQTRYLTNDACVLLHKPTIYGSIFRFEGQVTLFALPDGPCYRCLYPEPPPPGLMPSCAEGGVLGVLPGVIGLLQATEALKLVLGTGEPLTGRLLLFDALQMRFSEMKIKKNPLCPICGPNPSITGLIDYDTFCGLDQASVPPPASDHITPLALQQALQHDEQLTLLDVREPHEWQICRLPQAQLIPLNTLASHYQRFDKDENIVVYCRSGMRSARALHLLQTAGFERVRNLDGGILRWAQEIDPLMPTY